MHGPVLISPSILSADFLELGRDCGTVEDGGCDFLHVDVMDGHFVENLTIGPPHVKALKRIARVPLDVHLMISNPLHQIDWYLDAGADLLTFHIETVDDPVALIEHIHERGAKAGVTLCPPTPTSALEPAIPSADLVLVMSVNPGFSGQSFIANSPDRVREVCAMAEQAHVAPLIEVDGGVNVDTAPLVTAAGADVLVAGNAVFKADDPKAAIAALRAAGEACRA